MELPNELPTVKSAKTMVETLITKLDAGSPQAITVEGGSWDEKRHVYTSVDAANGITTEYTLKKSPFVQDKYVVQEKSYKVEKAPDGTEKRAEVLFNEKTQAWEKKGIGRKATEALQKPKYMSAGVEVTKDAQGASTMKLRIEQAKSAFIRR